MSEPQPEGEQQSKRRPQNGLLFLLLALLVGALFTLTAYLVRNNAFGDQSLTLLLIGGLSTFLVILAFLVLLFRTLGLTDSRFALALPEGSVRAIIALGLILLFAILVLTIYFSEHATTESGQIDGISAAQLAAIPLDQIKSSTRTADGTFSVIRIVPPTQSSQELAKQVVTTVGTLVIAISAFYFGSTIVASATGVEGNNPTGRSAQDTGTEGVRNKSGKAPEEKPGTADES
ncbi:hypothetical protein AB0J55_13055 [Amycolatopsis sp. NPDC049688]|uniref:hypothetical protein n=1 Tax=Amycolatopsis sp. NPDC049688 TaxID=3154733 RepID=UPI003429DA27